MVKEITKVSLPQSPENKPFIGLDNTGEKKSYWGKFAKIYINPEDLVDNKLQLKALLKKKETKYYVQSIIYQDIPTNRNPIQVITCELQDDDKGTTYAEFIVEVNSKRYSLNFAETFVEEGLKNAIQLGVVDKISIYGKTSGEYHVRVEDISYDHKSVLISSVQGYGDEDLKLIFNHGDKITLTTNIGWGKNQTNLEKIIQGELPATLRIQVNKTKREHYLNFSLVELSFGQSDFINCQAEYDTNKEHFICTIECLEGVVAQFRVRAPYAIRPSYMPSQKLQHLQLTSDNNGRFLKVNLPEALSETCEFCGTAPSSGPSHLGDNKIFYACASQFYISISESQFVKRNIADIELGCELELDVVLAKSGKSCYWQLSTSPIDIKDVCQKNNLAKVPITLLHEWPVQDQSSTVLELDDKKLRLFYRDGGLFKTAFINGVAFIVPVSKKLLNSHGLYHLPIGFSANGELALRTQSRHSFTVVSLIPEEVTTGVDEKKQHTIQARYKVNKCDDIFHVELEGHQNFEEVPGPLSSKDKSLLESICNENSSCLIECRIDVWGSYSTINQIILVKNDA